MKLQVTQEDIDNSCRDAYYCPIANALNRQFPGSHASVGCKTFGLGDKDSYKTTLEMKVFIMEFDYNRPVSPTIFDIGEVFPSENN